MTDNTKRDWMKHQEVADAMTGYNLARESMGKDPLPEVVADMFCGLAESIVRRELAGEVEKMKVVNPNRNGRVFSDALRHVLALLSPQNEKDQ